MDMGKKCECGHTRINHVFSEEKGHGVCIKEKCAWFIDFCDLAPKESEPKLRGKQKMIHDCQSKVQFMTQKRAHEAKKEFGERHGTVLRPYWCPVCGFYHLTTKPLIK